MAPVAESRRFTVLLSDDQSGWQQTVSALLQPQGVVTVSARTGRAALEMLEAGDIHCAVLDAQMPQLNGLQVIKRLRDRHVGTPAILLAQTPNNHLLQEALGVKVFSVLSKPVDFNLLLDSLARVLKRHYESRWPTPDAPGETH